MKWTEAQLQAINLREKNILVAAAAGSGKTSVLVERIRKMVCDEEIPLRGFLVVTFTNAAAAEMKERLRIALNKELESLMENEVQDRKKSKYLRQQLLDLETANISTFHSFGLSVIRRFFYKLDIEPGFRTADEMEIGIMKEDAMDELLEKEFETFDHDFIAFMDAYSGDRNNYAFRGLISQAHTRLSSMPHAYEWMDERIKDIDSIGDNIWESSIGTLVGEEILSKLKQVHENYYKAAELLDNTGLGYLADLLRKGEIWIIEDSIEALLGGSKLDYTWLEALQNFKSSTLRAAKEDSEAYESVKPTVKRLRDNAKKTLDSILDSYLSMDGEASSRIIRETAPYLRTLKRLVMEYDQIYRDIKREQGVIDFDDIEHYTLEALEDQEVRAYYTNTIKFIFVDEYQDTNLMQEAIIQRIAGERNLFMVGDIKQSIYRFRLAEPSIFQGKYQVYSSGQDENSVAIDLNENHRSKEPIIHYINRVFEPLMEGYDERARLYLGDKYRGELNREPELVVLVPQEDEEIQETELEEEPETFSAMEQEAHYIAKLIKENIGKPFYDSKMNPPGERPLTAKDIVILRRSVVGCQETYQNVLRLYGIESHIEGDDGYFDTMEISGFMDLLQVIDNIRRDVELIGALHSEIFSFTAEDLARIRIQYKEGSFADAFLHLALGDEDVASEAGPGPEVGQEVDAERNLIAERCIGAYEQILSWREMSRTMTLPNFIWKVMVDSGYYSIMGALPQGEKRQANLRLICDIAENFCRYRLGTLFDFLKYVESIKKGNIKTLTAKDGSGSEPGVAIMTIHKSKGLEFPMVIVSGLGRRLVHDKIDSFSMHKDIGVALRLVNREGHWNHKTLLQSLIAGRIYEEELEEEIRILYVAMTRARDRLFMVAHQKNEGFEEMAKLGVMGYTDYLGMMAPWVPIKIERPIMDERGVVLPKVEDKSEANLESELSMADPEEIISKLEYKYPYLDSRSLKSKYSVSELNKEKRRKTEIRIKAPASQDDTLGFSAAERGTIYHRIMECLDFSKFSGIQGEKEVLGRLEEEVGNLMNDKKITPEEASAVDLKMISSFFLSELGKRTVDAGVKGLLRKEQPFTLKMKKESCKDSMENKNDDEILVQGIIDCYFLEENKEKGDRPFNTILVDYKSNWIDRGKPIEEEEARLREEYQGQMDIYRLALEEAGLGPVSETYLYLLNIGKGVAM